MVQAHSLDDSPPAIPPRVRIRKHAKQETSNSISDKNTEESLRGLTENPEVSCSRTHDNETDVNEIIPDSDLSKTVDQKQNCSFDKNTTKLTDTISDLSETNKSLNTSEDLNEPIHMSLEEVINEPIHMTLEDVLKQRHSERFRDNSDTDINHSTGLQEILDNADNCSSLHVPDNIDIENECLTSLRESLLDRDKIETKHKAISESQSVNVRTEIENLHLDAIGLSLLNCDTSLHASDRADDLVDPVPPRPPPPVFRRPDNTEQGQHLAEESDDNEDQRTIADLRSPSSEDAEQVSDMLPLVFRPRSGSNQADSQEDDSPPAIPPRVRIRKHAKQASTCYKDFMESMRQLKDVGWYWGPLIREEAETKLANKVEGSFLVRDSSYGRYILSLSLKHQGHVYHARIEHHRGQFSFGSQPESHGKSTIKDFIEQCVENSRNGRFLYFIRPWAPGAPPLLIHLLHPVSRFTQMRSLQHMCRFAIVQIVRRDHIDDLPLPTRIKKYLQEAQYYIEYLGD